MHAISLMQCHRGVSLDTFFNGILSEPVKLAVAGCGCSVATEPVAEISPQWNISQVAILSKVCSINFLFHPFNIVCMVFPSDRF